MNEQEKKKQYWKALRETQSKTVTEEPEYYGNIRTYNWLLRPN